MKHWRVPHAVVLILIATITYLPFFWERGFYWDEAPWTWIYFRLGPEALTRTFSTSRPFWGMIYQITLPIFGPYPWVWQITMTITRAFSAFLFYKLLRTIWKDEQNIPTTASILFLVYPGLSQNYLGLMYTHFYIVLNFFLGSFLLTAKATQKDRVWLHLPALLLASANILMMEYFYFLELLRPVFIWVLLGGPKHTIKRSALHSALYLLAFFSISAWRFFFFSNQNASYSYGTLDALRANPIEGFLQLARMVMTAFWNTAILVWARGVDIFIDHSTGIFTLGGAIFIASLLATLLLLTRDKEGVQKTSLYSFGAAFAIWLLSGGAFWLVGMRTLPELHFSADRFTMPFMAGASLLLALGLRHIKNDRVRNGIFISIIALAGAWQFSMGRSYAQDKADHDRFFSQLIARVPGLEPGTAIVTNDLPFTYYSDNSLSGTLNWIYSEPGKMRTILYYASVRSADGRALGGGFIPDQAIEQNYLARVFYGNTSDILVFEYTPPGCLRLLDPEIDPLNKLLPVELRDAANLSDPSRILTARNSVIPPHLILRQNDWCDAYESASISAAKEDWGAVVEVYKTARSTGLTPQAPVENLIFIEAFARNGELTSAFELSENVRAYSKNYTTPPLCALWQRIQRETEPSEENQTAITTGLEQLGCGDI